MSFQRIGGPAPRKKLSGYRKPAWDDSVHDLTVYKSTPDEILMRKEAHKSKNHMSVKLEKMRKEKERLVLTGAEAKQLAIMKEVLYDQQQLQKIIAKSDKMMAVVKDIFGDDPKRFTGFPNITSAPKASSTLSQSLVPPVPEIYTRTEKLSDSVMSASALNDVDTSDSDDDEKLDLPEPISYVSQMDMQKFQQLLQDEERNLHHQDRNMSNNESNVSSKASEEMTNNGLPSHFLQFLTKALSERELESKGGSSSQDSRVMASLMTALADSNSDGLKTPPRSQQNSPPFTNGDQPQSAINDTTKVKKTQKRSRPPAPEENANSSMADMRKALQDLEQELTSYEHQIGHRPHEEKNKSETFSGYTVSLVNAVSRLTRYLKETQLRLKTEVTLREQLTEDVLQLRTIIDALATDIIMTQEEYAKLYSENQRYRETTAQILHAMKTELQEIRSLATGESPEPGSGAKSGHGEGQGVSTLDKDEPHINSARSLTSCNSSQESSKPPASNRINVSERNNMDAKLKATAVLLSPPVRKTRVSKDNKGTRNSSGSPQNPSVIESICVPRPIPLVQSNLPVNLSSTSPTNSAGDAVSPNERGASATDLQDLINLGDHTQEQLNSLQEMAVEEMLKNPTLQSLMQTQIAELNRQQEEARMRLQDLLANQKVQQRHLQEQLGSNVLSEGNSYEENSRNQVSPPISPISHGSEKLTSKETISRIPRGPGITLSLPMVDLDVSTGSLTSQ